MPNYKRFLKWHAECDEASGSLIDSIGGLNFGELNGVGSTPGIIGNARSLPAATDGFSRSADAGGPFDLRSQSVPKVTFCGWYKADSLSSGSVFAEQVGAANETAWAMRCVHQYGGGNDQAVTIHLRDVTNGDWDYTLGVPASPGIVMPTGEWMFMGWSLSIPDDRCNVWLYTQSAGQHFFSFDSMASFDVPFDYTSLGVTYFGQNTSGGSIGATGMLGDKDQIDMFHGIEFREADVIHFWNDGAGRAWPGGYSTGKRGARRFHYRRAG